MRIKEEEFEAMHFKCHGVEKVMDIDNWDQLDIPNDVPKGFLLPFVKYNLYMYDSGSPLPRKIQNLEKRQREALKLCGIDQTIYGFEVQDMKSIKYDGQVDLVMSILKGQNELMFSSMVANENHHHSLIQASMHIIEEEDSKKFLDASAKKTKLLEQADEVMERILKLRERFYSTTTQEEEQKIYRRIRPENAHKFREM